MIGFMITTTPLRVPLAQKNGFFDPARRMQDDIAQLHPYSTLPHSRIANPTGEALFDAIFAYDSLDISPTRKPATVCALNMVWTQSISHHPIALAVVSGAKLELNLQYREGPLDGDGALEQFEVLLEVLVTMPTAAPDAQELLLATARHRILEDFAGIATAFADQTVVALFERQVELTPDSLWFFHCDAEP